MQDEVINVTAYWILPNGNIYRKWDKKEYKQYDFTYHKQEKILWQRCAVCGCLTYALYNKDVDKNSTFICSECHSRGYTSKDIKYNSVTEVMTELHTRVYTYKYINNVLCSFIQEF